MESDHRTKPFSTVPETMEWWVIKLLGVMIALLFVAIYLLFDKVSYLEDYTEQSRQLRIEFESEQVLRTCVILGELGISPVQMENLKC